MGRQERERKARQNARRQSEGEPGKGEATPPEAGSEPNPPETLASVLGDHWAARPGGKGERENAKLISQALRWNTNANGQTFADSKPDALSVKEIAILATRQGLLIGDSRAKAHHVGNVIRMEGQNQRDDMAQIEPPQPPVTERNVRDLFELIDGANDEPLIIDAVYRMADPSAVGIQPGDDGPDDRG